MQSLWLLTKKNIRLLLRSKASALIIVFAPLMIILLLGLSFNTSEKFGLNIGVNAVSFSEDINSFTKLLQEKEFTIIKYEADLENCINDVKRSVIHTCVSLPESLQIEGNTAKKITFHVDPSRVNLVWMIQETIKEKFNIKAQELSQSLAQDILTRLSDTKTRVSSQKGGLSSLKEKTTAASSTTESAKSGLASVDFTVPASSYDKTVIANVSSELSAATTKITDALTVVDSANMSSSDKSNIKSLLNKAKSKLDGAVSSVNSTASGGIAGLIASLEADLESVKTKLSTAAGMVESTNSNLATVSSTLSESATAIDSLQAELDGVIANLEAQKVTDPGTISSPLVTKVEKVSDESTYLNYLFPAILVLVVMFSSLLLGTTLVMMEKNSPAFLRNFFLPVRKATFIISTYLTNLILIVIQIIVILGISLFFLKRSFASFAYIGLILFTSASVFTFLGMIVGYTFTSEETGILASISLGSLLLFLSGVIFPLEGVSLLLRGVTYFNPFVIAEKLIREVFIFNASLANVWIELLLLIGYAIVFFLVILIMESLLHKHLVHKFLRHHHLAHIQKDKKKKNVS